MSAIRASYTIDPGKKPKMTPFQADMIRFLHISDCSVVNKVWKSYWAHCPVCGAHFDLDGYLEHRLKKDVIC